MPVLEHGRSQLDHLVGSVNVPYHEHDSHSQRHEKKHRAHVWIYASDDLVHRKKGRKNIVSEDYIQPIFLRHACQVLHEASRSDHE